MVLDSEEPEMTTATTSYYTEAENSCQSSFIRDVISD